MSLDVSDFPLNLDPEAIPQIPIPEPENICAGGTITWRRQFDTYLPGGGFSLSYVSWQTSSYSVNGSMMLSGPNTLYLWHVTFTLMLHRAEKNQELWPAQVPTLPSGGFPVTVLRRARWDGLNR